MHITSVSISITTVNLSGVATSAPTLVGHVTNMHGDCVEVLTLEELTETSIGVYEIAAYDVTDSDKFPGTEFTIFWGTSSTDTTPQTALQRYEIYGEHPSGVSTRLFNWCPSFREMRLYGYQVSRKLAVETEFTVIGRTVFPYFFDRNTYANPVEFYTTTFQIHELVWKIDGVDTPSVGNAITLFTVTENQKEYCQVYGEVYDVMGGARAEHVNFFVHEQDMPQVNEDSFLMRRNGVIAPVNYRGEFSIPLIKGALVTAEIADAGIYRRFVVPNAEHVNLKDLDFFPLETHRAQ